MQQYFANFIKFGNPIGEDLASWPLFSEDKFMRLSAQPEALPIDTLKKRYAFHQKEWLKDKAI
ncbi:MAG: para-nitrobenzyl esterase [Paraglaciecola sp.]|jgi:para-nitrobenzyl esterase